MGLEGADFLEGVETDGADHEEGQHIDEHQSEDGQHGMHVARRDVLREQDQGGQGAGRRRYGQSDEVV